MDKNEFLEHERLELQTRLTQSLEKSDIGTYKNLIQAYERILTLQSQEDKWVQMYSKYETKSKEEDDFTPVVSVWEQKGEEIRNHRIFEIVREIEDKEYELYFEVSRNSDGVLLCEVFFNKRTYRIAGDQNVIGDYIKDLIGDKKVIVYGDSRNIRALIVDSLKARNIKVITRDVITNFR